MNYDTTDRDLIGVILEKVLLKMGPPELEMVETRLKEDYDCNVSDCLYNPTYLKTILSDLFGDSYEDIVISIQKEFAQTTMNKPIKDFLTVLTA